MCFIAHFIFKILTCLDKCKIEDQHKRFIEQDDFSISSFLFLSNKALSIKL